MLLNYLLCISVICMFYVCVFYALIFCNRLWCFGVINNNILLKYSFSKYRLYRCIFAITRMRGSAKRNVGSQCQSHGKGQISHPLPNTSTIPAISWTYHNIAAVGVDVRLSPLQAQGPGIFCLTISTIHRSAPAPSAQRWRLTSWQRTGTRSTIEAFSVMRFTNWRSSSSSSTSLLDQFGYGFTCITRSTELNPTLDVQNWVWIDSSRYCSARREKSHFGVDVCNSDHPADHESDPLCAWALSCWKMKN